MTLQLFNVLGREKQTFVPVEEGRINMYVCGPTVQDYSHVGHAKTYVNFDMVVRWLRYTGLDVLYVQNITDVGHLLDDGEDRILKKARQLAAGPMQIVEHYQREYFADMDSLGILRPDISPRASAHVPEQIEMVQELIKKGNAYEVDGSVYFDVRSHDEYGKLSNRRIEDQEAGAREAVRGEKRNPEDFALWKKAEPEHIMRWNSPWGEGFPGWHVECSAMARKYLGETFDLHGGGVDNIFPHNECEIAQSECANDVEFANYWMLVGSLNVPDEDGIPVKMSKSLGNFYTIKDAIKRWRPEAIRLFMFSAHYSNPVVFSEDALDGAVKGWERLNGAARLTRAMLASAPVSDAGNAILETVQKSRDDFAAALNDDFNAPLALSVLQTFTREVNTLLNSDAVVGQTVLEQIDGVYRDLGGTVLGIIPEGDAAAGGGNAQREDGLIKLLVDLRQQARANKDWATSDQIRDELAELGVALEDRADGTVWKVG
ncbi:cysteine--tRNA ligase [Chloroflexota bacterium]